MRQALQRVVTATVVIMIASTLFFLISSNVGNASENQQEMVDDADCDYLRGQFEQERAFGSEQRAENAKEEASSGGCDTSNWGSASGSDGDSDGSNNDDSSATESLQQGSFTPSGVPCNWIEGSGGYCS